MRVCGGRELGEEVSLAEQLSLMNVWCDWVRLPILSFDPEEISRLRMRVMLDYLELWMSRPSPLWLLIVSVGWPGV